MPVRRLIKGGTVVDGTGAPAYRADVRIRDGLIHEIAEDIAPEPREHVIDAAGCYVTPGFIELHNHWDVGIWWTPTMDPVSGYGITTSVNGNCAFSAAPLGDEPGAKEALIEIFNFFEDIPDEAMRERVPWTWRKWSELRATLEARVKVPVNFAAYCGHIALRLAAMGADAWTRPASEAEIARMCDLLDDALTAGALGLSSNLVDNDRRGRPVPSRLADDREWEALLDVVASHQGATVQMITDMVETMIGYEQVAHIGRIAAPRGVRLQWLSLPIFENQMRVLDKAWAVHEDFKARGAEIYSCFHWLAPVGTVTFVQTLFFTRANNRVWHDLTQLPGDAEKLATLADPKWRERARESWNNQYPHAIGHHPDRLNLKESETGCGPVGCTLADYMEQSGIEHPSDALAEWLLTNGIGSTLQPKPVPASEQLMDNLVRLARDPRTVGGLSDFGAHGKVFCGVGHNITLLTTYVRDQKRLTIEEAVNILTGRVADFFSFEDRGRLEVGKRADIAVFDLDEIGLQPEIKAWDVPDGEGGTTYRYIRAPAPMRATLVNGEATFYNGAFTGKFPGAYIGPTPARPASLAQAAE